MNIFLKILIVLIVLALLYVLFEVVRIGPSYRTGRMLADNAIPFERTGAKGRDVLVLGDSVAVGTGATSSEASFIGLVGEDFSEYNFENVAFNGAKIADIESQLSHAKKDRYDRVILLVGGNDTLYFTSISDMESGLDVVLPQLGEIADRVVLMNGLRAGRFHIFPYIFQDLYISRTRNVQQLYRDIEKKYDFVDYFDMSVSVEEDVFVTKRDEMHSEDRFHPSDAGYRVWFDDFIVFLKERNIDF